MLSAGRRNASIQATIKPDKRRLSMKPDDANATVLVDTSIRKNLFISIGLRVKKEKKEVVLYKIPGCIKNGYRRITYLTVF